MANPVEGTSPLTVVEGPAGGAEASKAVAADVPRRAPQPRTSSASKGRSATTALWRRYFRSPRTVRLETAIAECGHDLEARAALCADPASGVISDPQWLVGARKHIEDARGAFRSGSIDGGWQSLRAAQRMAIWSYRWSEIRNSATILHQEAAKLKEWRCEAIRALAQPLLPAESAPVTLARDSRPAGEGTSRPDAQAGSGALEPLEDARSRLLHAAVLRDEAYMDKYHKIALRRRNLWQLFALLLMLVVAAPLLARSGMLSGFISDWGTVLAVELFGALGAAFSVATTLTRQPIDDDIPDQLVGAFVTWMRPVTGAAAALGALLLWQAGALAGLFTSGVAQAPEAALLVVAFLAGFSERFFISALDMLATRKDGKGR